MIITKKAIPRRTVLRGVGAALALPLLDGMVPALTPLAEDARPSRPARLGIVHIGATASSWSNGRRPAEGAALRAVTRF